MFLSSRTGFSVPNSEAAGAARFQGLNATSFISITVFLSRNQRCFPFPYHCFALTWTVPCGSGGKFGLGSWGCVCAGWPSAVQRDGRPSWGAGRSPAGVPFPELPLAAGLLTLLCCRNLSWCLCAALYCTCKCTGLLNWEGHLFVRCFMVLYRYRSNKNIT